MTIADAPCISIVVPLAGAPVQALRCFEGIAAQADVPAYEVIVVDDASVGLDSLLARLGGDVELIKCEQRVGFARAAAIGAQRAQGEIIVFVRDGAQPAPGWLASLTAPFQDPSVGFAASATYGDATGAAVTAWSAALRAAHIRETGVPEVPDPLVIGALALSVAEQGLRVSTVTESVVVAPGPRTGAARQAPGEAPEVTIVIPTLDAASDRVRSCISAIQLTTEVGHEIVVIDNGSPPQGFTAPVNAGLRAARTPYVVVMNDDVQPLPGWWTPLRAALDAGAAVAFPLTVDGGMRYDFPAWCFAMKHEEVVCFSHAPGEFFDPSFVVWYQDTDLLFRLREAGRPPVLARRSRIRHGLSETVRSEDPLLKAWIAAAIIEDQARFQRKHPERVPSMAEEM